jgi:hypothetical protein
MFPFQRKPNLKDERTFLQLPYRSTSIPRGLCGRSNLKIQIVVLNMIANLSGNRRIASALEVFLKMFSSIVMGIACNDSVISLTLCVF